MELIAAVLLAFPLGRWLGAKRGLIAYLVLWAVIFPVQTVSVHADGNLESSYFVVNAVILALGITLNRWGARRGSRRASATTTVEVS
ncbi:MAG: hypothetical protein M3R46_05715 [Actinomycetota bacterium]|jgi:lipopolysaccharide export LptBFGC system permease protein LptF|nr:hypothetical protein [Actinomycetota bacterium]